MTVKTTFASGQIEDTPSDNRFLLVALAASCLAISLRQSDLVLGVVTSVGLPLAWRRRLALGPTTTLGTLVWEGSSSSSRLARSSPTANRSFFG